MPPHVVVDYKGEVLPPDVPSVFASADLFVFPTKGENFGHVILEALSVGTPVLTSDQTPWRGDLGRGLEELSLEDPTVWQERLQSWALISQTALQCRRRSALTVAQNFLNDPNHIKSTVSLFRTALKSYSDSPSCLK